MNFRQFDLAITGLAGVFNANVDKLGLWDASGTCLLSCIHAVSGNQFGLGAFVCAEHLENGNEVIIGKVGVIAGQESIDVAAGQACAFGEITLHEIPPFCFALKCYSKITHEIAYANGSWFATFSRKIGRKFFVQTVSQYGIATELQSKTRRFPMVDRLAEHLNGIQEGTAKKGVKGMTLGSNGTPTLFPKSSAGALCWCVCQQKVVNNFFKFLFPQARTGEAKGSENRDKEFLAGAGSEKTGCIRGTRTKANEYEH